MVNRPASISKFLGRDFSIKNFFKNCHSDMVGHKKNDFWSLENTFPSILNTLFLD